MNKIVRKHYPVRSLPDDLRAGLPPEGWVDITITTEPRGPRPGYLSTLAGAGRNVHGDEKSVLDHIDALRADR